MRQMEARCASVMCTVQSGLRDSMAKGEVWHNNRYLLVEVNNRCAMHAVDIKVRANDASTTTKSYTAIWVLGLSSIRPVARVRPPTDPTDPT